jgi:DNA topoisomerase-1
VTFDFLGKDSMRYLNEVEVIPKVFKNLKLFCSKKSDGDQIFDQLTTTLLNTYLKSLMLELTAKVFRTYNASVTLEKELRHSEKDVSVQASVDEKLYFYNKYNNLLEFLQTDVFFKVPIEKWPFFVIIKEPFPRLLMLRWKKLIPKYVLVCLDV